MKTKNLVSWYCCRIIRSHVCQTGARAFRCSSLTRTKTTIRPNIPIRQAVARAYLDEAPNTTAFRQGSAQHPMTDHKTRDTCNTPGRCVLTTRIHPVWFVCGWPSHSRCWHTRTHTHTNTLWGPIESVCVFPIVYVREQPSRRRPTGHCNQQQPASPAFLREGA